MIGAHLPQEVLWGLGGIGAFLLFATLATTLGAKIKGTAVSEELRLRLRTWWIICGLFGASMLLSASSAIALFAFVSFLALKEYLSLIPTRRADRRVLFWAYLAIPFQYWWVHEGWYGVFIIFIPVYLFLFLPARMVGVGITDGFLRAAGTLHWGLMTTVFSLSHAAFLLVMTPSDTPRFAPDWPAPESAAAMGPGLLLLLIVLTQLNDVAQYVWGKSLGKTKIVPKVSPGKTVVGFVGGVLTTIGLSTLLGPRLTIMDWERSMIAGALIGIGGFVGDVVLSSMKRDLGVKDSGTTLPGHGGILDRVDSLTYTAPIFFHYVFYCYA